MKPAEYLEAIQTATTAAELKELRDLTQGDPDLNPASRLKLVQASHNQFKTLFAPRTAPRPAGRPDKVRHPKKGATK